VTTPIQVPEQHESLCDYILLLLLPLVLPCQGMNVRRLHA
jgi:hypothetical protein